MVAVAVGDEVGYCRYGNWGTLMTHGFSRVVKVNGHGYVFLENGRQFDKNGYERKKEYDRTHLIDPDLLRDQLAEIERKRARNRAVAELKQLIEGRRNGHGDYCEVDDELRAKMIELVNQL